MILHLCCLCAALGMSPDNLARVHICSRLGNLLTWIHSPLLRIPRAMLFSSFISCLSHSLSADSSNQSSSLGRSLMQCKSCYGRVPRRPVRSPSVAHNVFREESQRKYVMFPRGKCCCSQDRLHRHLKYSSLAKRFLSHFALYIDSFDSFSEIFV